MRTPPAPPLHTGGVEGEAQLGKLCECPLASWYECPLASGGEGRGSTGQCVCMNVCLLATVRMSVCPSAGVCAHPLDSV